MRQLLIILIAASLFSACGESPNREEELQAVAGSYFGKLKLREDVTLSMQLQLKPNGFYVISHEDLEGKEQLVRENGVFILQEDEIELARRQAGFRYFRFVKGKIFVYNLFHEPYTSFSDSSFYLRRQSLKLEDLDAES